MNGMTFGWTSSASSAVMPTSFMPLSRYFASSATSSGNSATQGPHHVAQKLSTHFAFGRVLEFGEVGGLERPDLRLGLRGHNLRRGHCRSGLGVLNTFDQTAERLGFGYADRLA